MANEKRKPTSAPNPVRDLFQNAHFILGENHVVSGRDEPCGPNCPYRTKSISCPFFKPTVPCLVGCTIQYSSGTPGEGLDYEEAAIFVISQAGTHLIGYENIVNIDSPKLNRLRILTDKYGNELAPPEAQKDMTIFGDMQEGEIISEVVELEGKVGQEDEQERDKSE